MSRHHGDTYLGASRGTAAAAGSFSSCCPLGHHRHRHDRGTVLRLRPLRGRGKLRMERGRPLSARGARVLTQHRAGTLEAGAGISRPSIDPCLFGPPDPTAYCGAYHGRDDVLADDPKSWAFRRHAAVEGRWLAATGRCAAWRVIAMVIRRLASSLPACRAGLSRARFDARRGAVSGRSCSARLVFVLPVRRDLWVLT